MEIAVILRALWARRVLAALGLPVALAAAVLVGSAPPTSAGVAATRVALDTRPSQLVVPAPAGDETLGWRATLLAGRLMAQTAEQRIARAVGIPRESLIVLVPSLTAPEVPTAIARRADKAAGVLTETYAVVLTPDAEMGTVAIEAHAPTRGDATRLADATADALAAEADPATAPSAQRLVVERTADIAAHTVTDRGGPVAAIAVAVVLLALWCTGVLLVPVVLAGLSGRRTAPV